MLVMPVAKKYRMLGFLFHEKRVLNNPEDYFDFEHLVWSKEELMCDLRSGNLPQGSLILYPDCSIRVAALERGLPKLIQLDVIMALFKQYTNQE